VDPSQEGFRRLHSTQRQVQSLHWVIDEEARKRTTLYVAYLDFENEFNSIDHEALFRWLEELQILDSRISYAHSKPRALRGRPAIRPVGPGAGPLIRPGGSDSEEASWPPGSFWSPRLPSRSGSESSPSLRVHAFAQSPVLGPRTHSSPSTPLLLAGSL
jgi:hypothetical protein